MTPKVLHINNPSKDILNIFMKLRTEKEDKARSIKKAVLIRSLKRYNSIWTLILNFSLRQKKVINMLYNFRVLILILYLF